MPAFSKCFTDEKKRRNYVLKISETYVLKQTNISKFLLVGVIVWDLCPVVGETFEVGEQRSDLFLYVSLREEDVRFVNLHLCLKREVRHPEMIN